MDVKCYDNHDHVGIDHHRMDVLLPEKAPKVGHSMFLMNVFLSSTLNPLSLPSLLYPYLHDILHDKYIFFYLWVLAQDEF